MCGHCHLFRRVESTGHDIEYFPYYFSFTMFHYPQINEIYEDLYGMHHPLRNKYQLMYAAFNSLWVCMRDRTEQRPNRAVNHDIAELPLYSVTSTILRVSVKGIYVFFFILTLEQIIVLNRCRTYNIPIPKISHVETLPNLCKMRSK